MLRIDVGRFTRRAAKKLRIELVYPVDKSTASCYGATGQTGLSIVKSLNIPAVRRYIADRLPTLQEKFP